MTFKNLFYFFLFLFALTIGYLLVPIVLAFKVAVDICDDIYDDVVNKFDNL